MPTFQRKNKDHKGEKPTVEVNDTNAAILAASGRYVEVEAEEEAETTAAAAAADVEATGAAQAKADELGVSLSDVEGTGKGGAVLVSDVEKAAKK